MEAPRQQIMISSSAEDSQDEPYNKRFASDHIECGARKTKGIRDGSQEHSSTLSGTSGDFPQKRQKVEMGGVFENEVDLIYAHKSQDVIPRLYSGGCANESLQQSESSAGATTDILSDSDSSEPSLTHDSHSSVTSSRSSSRSPDLGVQPRVLSDSPSIPDYGCQFIALFDDAFTPVGESPEDPSVTNEAVPRSLLYSFTFNNRTVARTTSSVGNSDGFRVHEEVRNPQDNEYIDQSPSMRSTSPSNISNPAASSISEAEDPSTEGDRSSQSQPSSTVSGSSISDDNDNADHSGSLHSLIRNELRTDPDVAELLFRALDGRLECAPSDHSGSFEDSSELPLFSLLELQDSSDLQHSGKFTYAPSSSLESSSSSSTAYNQSGISSSSPNGVGLSLGATTTGRGPAPPNEGPGQLLKQKNNGRSSSTQSTKSHSLRCIHNALAPEIFCVSHETQDRFRACAGPGWNTISHLKEHMQSHHTTKLKLLQCSRCQEEFKSQDLLKSHEINVDCPIRCPDCREEFEKKAIRQAHQEENHLRESRESRFMEIDDAMDKKIKENLKTYADSLKKGKGSIDPALEKWISLNTRRYMIGRSPKVNPRLELGQWYTIFTTLASETAILEHPFYDYGLTPSDLASERILLINDSLIEAKIQIHGPPPTDLQPQRGWYQDVLRESLRVAAKTTLVMNKKTEPPSLHGDTANIPKPHCPNVSDVPGTGYNLSALNTSRGVTTRYQTAATHESQGPRMSTHLAEFDIRDLPVPNYLENRQQHTGMIAGLAPNLSHGTDTNSSYMTTELEDIGAWDFSQDVPAVTDPYFHPQGSFEFPGTDNEPFGQSGF